MLTFDPKFSEEQYTKFILNLCPPGPAFPRERFTTLYDFFSAFGAEFKRSDIRINELVKESYPALCNETIEDWFLSYGLPGCFDEPATLNDKIALLIFKLVGISDYYIQYGLSEDFITNLAADALLDYNITGFTYYDRLAVGPDESYNSTGDTAVGSDTIINVVSTAGIEVGHYLSISTGFTVGEAKVLAKTSNTIQVDRNANSSTTGASLVGYPLKPGGMGDGVGENLVHVNGLNILLPSAGYTSDPGTCVGGIKWVSDLLDTSGVNIGDYCLLSEGWNYPIQKVESKTATTITFENAADYGGSNVIVKSKTKSGALLECFFDKIFHSHTKTQYIYS